MDEVDNIQLLSYDLNRLFYGGIYSGKIYEICGPPGIGKTQICLQLCADTILNCTISMDLINNKTLNSSCLRDVVYIDTEQSFVAERLKEILVHSQNFEKHYKAHLNPNDLYSLVKINLPARSPTFGIRAQVENFTSCNKDLEIGKNIFAQNLLDKNLHYFICKDPTKLLALLILLPNYMEKHSGISLIIVDSMAFITRIPYHKIAQRNKILTILNQKLKNIQSSKSKVAIVLTNQIMFGENDVDYLDPHDKVTNCMTPCLGDVWSHTSDIRILLYFYNFRRYAKLINNPKSAIPFDIDTCGIINTAK